MVWMMPRRSTPLSGSWPWRATVRTRSASSSARRACATICSPDSVRNTPRLPRSNSVTPSSSSSHLPRYNELAPAFFANGVDAIVCISVNDAFVMNEWAASQECENILMLPDGNGEFTEGMGMLVDKTDLGFGKRSWRYSMLVRDGVVRKMFIEPLQPGDPFEVSDADTMLAYIAPKAKKPDQVAILTRKGCGYCARAKQVLEELGYDYAELTLDHRNRSRIVGAITGEATVPQVFINGRRIGGLEDLEKW